MLHVKENQWINIYQNHFVITVCYNTLHFVTLRITTIRYNPLQFVTIVWNKHLHVICYDPLQFVTTRYDPLQFVTIRYNSLHFVKIRYNSLQFVTKIYLRITFNETFHNKNMTRTIHYCTFCDYKSDRRYDSHKKYNNEL